ncbi:hypothetical protein PIB30_088380 [Stylosanthes scabra]|uniref:Uncharacterized protein n=1 Tax=Stylosanthes scabra TaxID=79078 RepID=A0ABU6UT35_9FABA|nr:hypothetical protein [Stylosanthes scabra]
MVVITVLHGRVMRRRKEYEALPLLGHGHRVSVRRKTALHHRNPPLLSKCLHGIVVSLLWCSYCIDAVFGFVVKECHCGYGFGNVRVDRIDSGTPRIDSYPSRDEISLPGLQGIDSQPSGIDPGPKYFKNWYSS